MPLIGFCCRPGLWTSTFIKELIVLITPGPVIPGGQVFRIDYRIRDYDVFGHDAILKFASTKAFAGCGETEFPHILT